LYPTRFPEDPFVIDFTITRVNPDYNGNTNPPLRTAYPDLFVQPQELDPPLWINPHAAGQTLFSRLDVTIDNQRVDCSETIGEHWFEYNVANRTICSSALRREKYGEDYKWISNTSERKYIEPVNAREVEIIAPAQEGALPTLRPYVPAVPLYRHPNLVACQNGIAYDSPTVSVSSTIRAGWDGMFPSKHSNVNSLTTVNNSTSLFLVVSCQNNALRIINKMKNTNGFLHPGVAVDLQLQQRNPLHILVERGNLTDNVYWQFPAPVDIPDTPVAAVWTIRINKISLLYESALIESLDEIERINRSTLEYPIDVPIERLNDLDGSVMHETATVPLPRGTRLIYLMFLHECQLMPNAVKNSYMSSRFRWPPYLDRMHLSLVGKNGIVYQKGLRDISKGRNSHSLRSLHAEMCKKNLYTKNFDAWFPPARNGISYDVIIPVDLSYYYKNFKEISALTVELNYTQPSMPRWSLRTFCVTQRVYQYSEKDRWTYKDTL